MHRSDLLFKRRWCTFCRLAIILNVVATKMIVTTLTSIPYLHLANALIMQSMVVPKMYNGNMQLQSTTRSGRSRHTDGSKLACNTPRNVTKFKSVATIRSNFITDSGDSDVPSTHIVPTPQLRSSVTPPILMPATFQRRVERKSTTLTDSATPNNPPPTPIEPNSIIPRLKTEPTPSEDRRTNLKTLKRTYLRAATASDLKVDTGSTEAALSS